MSKLIPIVPNVELGNLTAVLYSVDQDCFHLEKLSDYIKNNVERCLAKIPCNEYRLICLCKSDIEGDTFIEEFKKHQNKIIP